MLLRDGSYRTIRADNMVRQNPSRNMSLHAVYMGADCIRRSCPKVDNLKAFTVRKHIHNMRKSNPYIALPLQHILI